LTISPMIATTPSLLFPLFIRRLRGRCLETFLRYLVPDDAEIVWRHATEAVASARNLGARCRESHLPKAELYTWLAWQDPPGFSPGRALTKKILDPHSEHATPFVKWFRDLYQL
jgi:hypothetical protein